MHQQLTSKQCHSSVLTSLKFKLYLQATVELTMLWLDGDCMETKANTTALLTKDTKAKCAKYCSKSVTQGAAECCDNLWLPTLNFINAQQKV